MKYHYLCLCAGLGCSALPLSGLSQTILTGDQVIDGGSLVVSDGLLVGGGDVSLGAISNGYAPLVLSYVESGSVRQILVYASQTAVEYLWKEGHGNPALAQTKMSLGTDNTLSLYDASGTPSIVLSPVTGEIKASGGIRLLNGSLISDEKLVVGNSSSSAPGVGASVIASESGASGDFSSIVGGRYHHTRGTDAAVVGGHYNSAFGDNSVISGGQTNAAYGDASAVLGGEGNTASGFMSAVIGGVWNSVDGVGAISIGGAGNSATGDGSFASGFASRAQAFYTFVIGSSNIAQGSVGSWVTTDDLFVIGNGDPYEWGDDRSNAFVVHKNGATRTAGVIDARGGVRVPPSGDIPMGSFTSGSNPADLGAGLRYAGE